MKYKKIYLIAAAAAIALSPFYAASAQGGFVSSNSTTTRSASASPAIKASSLTNLNTTVSQLSSIRNKNYVILEGVIAEQIKDDDYLFKDATGTVDVDIDHYLWQGIKADPNTKLRLLGKIDHKRNGRLEVDIVQLELAN